MKRFHYTMPICLSLMLANVSCDPAPQPPQPAQPQAPAQPNSATPPAHGAAATEQPEPEYPPGATASLTRNFYVVFDGSGSMNEAPCEVAGADESKVKSFDTRLSGAKWAVEELMKSVPEDVNLGLWVFDASGSREVVPLGANNRAQFLDEIRNVSGGGGTPLPESMVNGAKVLAAQRDRQLGYGDFRLVVVTDGDAKGIEKAGKMALNLKIPIYSVGFCIDGQHDLMKCSVSYQAANSPSELAAGLKEALAEASDFNASDFQALKP